MAGEYDRKVIVSILDFYLPLLRHDCIINNFSSPEPKAVGGAYRMGREPACVCAFEPYKSYAGSHVRDHCPLGYLFFIFQNFNFFMSS